MNSKKNVKTLLFVILVLILVSMACLSSNNNGENNAGDNGGNTGPSAADLNATTVAIQKTQTAIDSADVPDDSSEIPENVYFTEFEDLNDWEYIGMNPDESDYVIDYADPGLYIGVPLAEDWVSIYYDLWITDVRLEVDFEFLSGAVDSSLDFYCRSNENGEYAFSIYADGYWEIGYYDYAGDDGYISYVSGQTTLNDGANFMVGYCEADELALFINEDFQGETFIPEVVDGGVGVGLLTFEGGEAEWFINYFAAEVLD